MDQYFETNKKLWDAKTPIHLDSDFYELEAFKAGKNVLKPIELAGLGDVSGKSMLHLQCHFGQDSMCWTRLGAKVTGIDFSTEAIKAGRSLSAELNIPVDFVESDVYGLKERLTGTFDIVFTSYGTITWLPDLDKWAAIINRFLKPGGQFVFAEFHPVVWMFDDDFKAIKYRYFNSGPIVETYSGTYANQEASIVQDYVMWNHGLGEVVTSLLNQGLEIKVLKEYDYSPYACFKETVEIGPRKFRIPGMDDKLPMVFALVAEKSNS